MQAGKSAANCMRRRVHPVVKCNEHACLSFQGCLLLHSIAHTEATAHSSDEFTGLMRPHRPSAQSNPLVHMSNKSNPRSSEFLVLGESAPKQNVTKLYNQRERHAVGKRSHEGDLRNHVLGDGNHERGVTRLHSTNTRDLRHHRHHNSMRYAILCNNND